VRVAKRTADPKDMVERAVAALLDDEARAAIEAELEWWRVNTVEKAMEWAGGERPSAGARLAAGNGGW
jgi:hypothetical protein